MHEIDRSSILSWQKCPRDRFYSRHFNGNGIERVRKSLPLAFGSAFHAGAEFLLRGAVEAAVNTALDYLDKAFTAEGIELEMAPAQVAYGIAEQKAIVEGLLRAWWSHDGERFVSEFEVIETEREGRAMLMPPVPEYEDVDVESRSISVYPAQDGMVLMFRPDALVREISSGDLYVVSWKTASTFGQYTVNQINTDMQSMSEVWGIQQEAASKWEETFNLPIDGPRPSINGVLYLFCVKGQRRMDDYLGFKTQDTPLAYGWVRKGDDGDEWAWRYKWASEEEGKKFTQLPKGFRKVTIWDNYPGGVKAWIADLHSRQIIPRHLNALDGVFPQSMPVSRRADEIESWKRQTVAQEKRVANAAEVVNSMEDYPAAQQIAMDEQFPQHTARCFDYNSRCSFYEACFTPAVHADPLGSGLYQIRIANHPESKGDSND